MNNRKREPQEKGEVGAILGRRGTVIFLIFLLILGGYYLLTGSDPLGLFEPASKSNLTEPLSSSDGGMGLWWQVYFTEPARDQNGELSDPVLREFIKLIETAETSIQIAMFEFDLSQIAESLEAANSRGVDIRWITDDEYGIMADIEEEIDIFPRLKSAGIEIRDDNRTALMHNKFAIFDRDVVWTGSMNLTENDTHRNNNNVIVINSPILAKLYELEFQEMWLGEFGPTSTSNLDRQALIIEETPVEVLFAAEDEVSEHLVQLIESAQSSIRFMVFTFTDDAIGRAISKKGSSGVETQGIFETRGSETEYSELSHLYCAGIPVRQDGNPGIMHHKVLIIDEQIVVTGSYNYTANADQNNDENLLIIRNRDVADQYLAEFHKLWSEAKDPERDQLVC